MQKLPQLYRHPLKNGLYYDMVLVKPGTFIMGSEDNEAYDRERSEHVVKITKDFYIGRFLVTQAVWKAVMGGHSPSHFKGDNRPVERVSWQDIVKGKQDESLPVSFLAQLHEQFPLKERSLKDWQFRWSTEAEWEYATKGGHHAAVFDLENPPRVADLYYKYGGSDKLKHVGWFDQTSHNETKEVGQLKPNELRLYDMSGNVFEWCLDRTEWLSSEFYKACHQRGVVEDPLGTEGHNRVYRGGSWHLVAQFCRSSYRLDWRPANRDVDVGFRLVLASSLAEWSKQV